MNDDFIYTILNVDDDEAGRYAKTRILQRAGYRVVQASTGAETLRRIAESNPQLILLDVMLPDINGLDLCRLIKSDPKTSHIMVLQISASKVTVSDRIHGLEGGADSYLTEPVEPEVLVASARSLLRLYQREEENRRLVQTAQEGERLLQSTFEQASEAILVCDNEGRIVRASHRAATLAGQYPVGQLFIEVFPLELAAPLRMRYGSAPGAVRPSLYELANVDPDSSQEASVVRCDGTRIYLLFSCRQLQRETDLERIGYTVALTDISVRKRLEEELKQRMEELKVVDRRKDDFLATLAHELRNPLAPIRNAAAILRRMHVADPQLQWCRDIIDQQVSQIGRLLDDLLDLSRITRDRLELRKERIALSQVIGAAVDISRPLIDEFEHALTVSVPAEPIDVVADEVRFTQVLSNLLNNAAKYTNPGGRISLTVARRENDLLVSVKDTGIGIAADKVDEIFEMFFQLERSLEQTRQGLGVGLTLVKRLVEMHGGTIQVRSDGPGQGSEFILRLPIVVEHTAETKTAAEDGDERPKTSSFRILVADDHIQSNESLTKVLQMMGYETHSAYDGEAAFAAAERFEPNLALLDIGMPKLNGYDLCRRIRQQPWGRTMILVALTGWGGEKDRQRGIAAGFNDHLTKPVPADQLEKLIADMAKSQPD
jgi:signal transduction histidine kinase/DNA-binding response OmpR family regulator